MDGLPYSIPVAAPLYGRVPYLYRGCPQLLVPFRTTPQVARGLVPEPLIPNPDDLMFLMIGQMNSDQFGTNREAFLAVPSSFGALEGNYAVALYLDNDAAIASGREVWGWPKKAAHFGITEDDGAVMAMATRDGVEIIRVRLEVAGPAEPKELRLNPTWFNLKLIPSIVPDAPPEVMQITSTTLENVRVSDLRGGQASLAFASTGSDPLADLIEVREVLYGMHFRLDCDLTLGEVIHDYLAAEATPTLVAARGVA
jgi:acetoacetate decarboxylase